MDRTLHQRMQAVHKHVNQKLLPIGEGAYQDPKAIDASCPPPCAEPLSHGLSSITEAEEGHC